MRLAAEEERLKFDLVESQKLSTDKLRSGFLPWTDTLSTENHLDSALNTTSTLQAQSYAEMRKRFPNLDDKQVAEYAKGSQMMSQADFEASKAKPKQKPNQKPNQKPPKPLTSAQQAKLDKKNQADYRKMLVAEIKKREADTKAQIEFRNNATKVRASLLKRIADPKTVFGEGKKQVGGGWETKKRVSDPAIMQLLENGFITNPAMPTLNVDKDGKPIDDAGKVGPRKEVMNAKGAATLAKWGFAPSNFGDTQHFDHVEGYSDAVEGGRSFKNMNKKYSPESKWILEQDAAPTTTPPAPTAPKPP